MNDKSNEKWTLWTISDNDEPGDAVYMGIRHRDFDSVKLVLRPDADGWLLTEATDQPVGPLLLFYRGGDDELKDALARIKKNGLDDPRGLTVPFPDTFEAYSSGKEATKTITTHLNYPPYPWLEEAKLGMEMGRYIDAVELTDWTEPTESLSGTYTFRFYRRGTESDNGIPHSKIEIDDLPF